MIDLNKIAVISGEYSVKYSELLKRVELYAKVTPQGKETKTIILSENRLGWVYSFFAVWLQEGIAVPVDVTSTAGDIAYILRDCQPDAVWVSKEREAVLLEAIQEAGIETKV
ncbi:MAG: AMP-binding protein, partial [Bacteroidaceae bacterium]|nr:AMP-binding protein [Bacteroidaceae bacterium]